MRIKISGVQNETEMKTAVSCGADAIGFLVGQLHRASSFILPSSAARLAGMLPPYVTPVIVTHLTDAEDIMDILRRTDIYSVQICGAITAAEIARLSDAMPEHGKIILSVYVNEQNKIPDMDGYYKHISAVTFDCFNRSPAHVGGSAANSYKWTTAREFMQKCPLPVILAGALSPENIADAVQSFRPFGVDACSMLKNPATGDLIEEKCRLFVTNARRASLN
ncbi:MAG: phosphoribosylanthranilate isomerase [Victivallaceae bacterium]